MRSALEKQKEERVQQRQERAERRARRSAGSDTDPFALASGTDRDGDASSEVGDTSFEVVEAGDGEPGPPTRHRRGPGDEEDYETPPRPERPAKRGRFEDPEGGEKEKERNMDVVQEKRVKWDRGLHTTVFLEDTPPNPKWNTKAVPSQKSCLTAAAKVCVPSR